MNSSVLSFFVGQIGAQLPSLLVSLAGMIAAIAWLRRARIPALTCLLGCGLMMITSIGVTVLQAWMLGMQQDGSWTTMRYGQAMSMVGITGGAVRAVGFALVVSAVFIGRQPTRSPVA